MPVGTLALSVRADASTALLALDGRRRRLDAVLDVDLPLVVRFGRAVMPLRALADLGPGSVVDMGRSPDEPVELLVGDRLIARGEVVDRRRQLRRAHHRAHERRQARSDLEAKA